MSSDSKINNERFDKCIKTTATLYVQLHDWYHMAPFSVQKILTPLSLIKHCLFSELSEKVEKARNADYFRHKKHHWRQNSRVKTNTDLFNLLLVPSHPIISKFKKLNLKRYLLNYLMKLSIY